MRNLVDASHMLIEVGQSRSFSDHTLINPESNYSSNLEPFLLFEATPSRETNPKDAILKQTMAK